MIRFLFAIPDRAVRIVFFIFPQLNGKSDSMRLILLAWLCLSTEPVLSQRTFDPAAFDKVYLEHLVKTRVDMVRITITVRR
jgi:hypothetical protein